MPNKIQEKLLTLSQHCMGKRPSRQLADWCYRARYSVRPGCTAQVTNLVLIRGLGLVVTGWLIDQHDALARVEVAPVGEGTLAIEPVIYRIADKILLRKFGLSGSSLKPGFVALLRLDAASMDALPECSKSTWQVRFKFDSGDSLKRQLRPMASWQDPLLSIRRLLQTAPDRAPDKRELFDQIYGPALDYIWRSRTRATQRPQVKHYNEHLAPGDPVVSVVIPIYGRYDFIEYQLSQFVDDPDMASHELLYVIDDPHIHDDVAKMASSIQHIYRMAFSIVYLPQNLGFSGANNVGVQYARSNRLLLMNSDVIPFEAGWLGRLSATVGSTIDTTVTGVRLLYEDLSVQHDGMSFEKSSEHNGLWINRHPAKGMPANLVSQQEICRPAEAVTGACLLLSRKNFVTMGGFDEAYILGDFEDSDLCLRARENGLAIQILDSISLCHLERQSQSLVSEDRWKEELTYYNCWYHTCKWDSTIKQLKSGVAL